MKNRIMLVRRATGKPRIEDQLNRLLTAAQIIKEDCDVIYVEEQEKDRILEQIKAAQPKVVVLFGSESAKAVLGRGNIESIRGGVYPVGGTFAIPTFDARAVLKGGGTSHWYIPAAINDLLRAKGVANGNVKACEPCYRMVMNPKELDDFFTHLAKTNESCAFDIETTYRGGEGIRCIGFSASNDSAIVVTFEDLNPKSLDLLAVIRKHMTEGKIGWIGQNAYNFDIPVIKKLWGFEVKNFVMDTMVAHHVLYPEFPHTLATIASFYSTIPYWKDTSEENLYKYNAYDACATYTAAVGMWKELWERGWDELYRTYYQALLAPLSQMTMRGMRIDKEYQQTLKEKLKGKAKKLQTELDKIYAEYTNTQCLDLRLKRVRRLIEGGRKTVKLPNRKSGKIIRKRLTSLAKNIEKEIQKKGSLNVRSTKDLAHFLYSVLGLPKKTKQGRVTTDVTALNQLFIKTHHPFLKTMITLRTKRNMLSRWGNLKTDEQGLIGTTYSFADTGRLRSGKFEAK